MNAASVKGKGGDCDPSVLRDKTVGRCPAPRKGLVPWPDLFPNFFGWMGRKIEKPAHWHTVRRKYRKKTLQMVKKTVFCRVFLNMHSVPLSGNKVT